MDSNLKWFTVIFTSLNIVQVYNLVVWASDLLKVSMEDFYFSLSSCDRARQYGASSILYSC